ncbi:baculoviral IAP repeat-containing protein 7-B-like [Cloeon dipterum]|uniref:baculoviral IAP repeat-containing protein 7-B-like n=1 Tax=Cloeon dipterum TaxID=197152 RepID=UPI00321FFE0E
MDPSKLDFNIELHRYISFPADFDERHPVNRRALTSSGFYFDIEKYLPRCHYCNHEASNFKSNPLEINLLHERGSPDCPLLDEEDESVNNFPIASVINYNFEAYRLFTFLEKKFPNSSVSPYELAADGFYFLGVDIDRCRCHFCNLEVMQWEDDDSAHTEHERWNPLCPFIKGCAYNIAIGNEIYENRRPNRFETENAALAKYGALKVKRNKATEKSDLKVSARTLGVVTPNSPSNPEMVNIQKRQESFKEWSGQNKPSVAELSAAGFYYTGKEDECLCFYCGLGLRAWEPQNRPLEEHEKISPKCAYVKLCKQPVEQSDQEVGMGFDKRCKHSGCPREVETACLPCGHMVFCEQCVQEHDQCPKCNRSLDFFLKIFVS